MAFNFNFINLSQVTVTQLYNNTIQWLTTTYNQSSKVFSLASGYGQITQVLLELSNMNLYYIEDSVTELNILTATRDNSILGLTTLCGHIPTRSISAKGQIQISWNGSNANMINGSIIVPNLNSITCTNNTLKYFLQINSDSLHVQLNQSQKYLINIIQGSYEVQIFQSDGTKLQSYYAQIGSIENIDNYIVNVYVNSEQWQTYDSFYDIPTNKKGVFVKTGTLPGIDIFFGNGDFGLIPPLGAEIRVEYVKTNGSLGDLNPTDDIKWTFTDTGYDQLGLELDLNSVLNVTTTVAPILGSDGEDIRLTKLIGPKTSRSFVLINPDSYIIFFQKFNMFSIVRAWTDLTNTQNNIIYLMLVPDITKRITTGQDYFSVNISEFSLSTNEKNGILEMLDESGSKIIGTSTELVDINELFYVININLKIFEGFEVNDALSLKSEIVTAISNYMLSFNREDSIPKSDITALIKAIVGVDSVSINFISRENETFRATPGNDSTASDLGIDSFGDIIFNLGDIPLIRGGWSDRYGIYYQDTIDFSKPSPVNIHISSVTPISFLNPLN